MRPEVRWPLFIGGLLALQVALGFFFFWKATSDPSFAVEEGYYQKAIHWEDHQAQEQHNSELGWKLEYSIGPLEQSAVSRTLKVDVFSDDGVPIEGAAVSVATFHNVRAGQILNAALNETAPGTYENQLAMLRPGLWEIRFTAVRGPETFTHVARAHISARRK